MIFKQRLKNLILFVWALSSLLFNGKRQNENHAPKKILVVQLSKLGDMVCITPVLRALRQNLPQAQIYVMGDRVNEKILEGSKDVDRYLVYDEKNLFSLINSLRQEKIDVALLRGTNFRAMVMAILAGIPFIAAPRVVGGRALETRTYRWLLPYVHTVTYQSGQYMPREFLRLLEPLNIFTEDTKKHLTFSSASDEKIQALFKTHNVILGTDFLVGISPSAGNEIKEWPATRFSAVADYLVKTYQAKIIVIGSGEEKAKAAKVIAGMSYGAVATDLSGELSIDELKSLIAKLHLFIAVDTGPIYIAEAFNVPTIDIVGPMDENEQPPRGMRHRSVYLKDRKEPMLHIMNARIYDAVEARRQVEGITAEQVIDETHELIEYLNAN